MENAEKVTEERPGMEKDDNAKVGDTVKIATCTAGSRSSHVGKVGTITGFSNGNAVVSLGKKEQCEATSFEVVRLGQNREQKVGNQVTVVECSKGNTRHVGMPGKVTHLNPSGRIVVKNGHVKCVSVKCATIEQKDTKKNLFVEELSKENAAPVHADPVLAGILAGGKGSFGDRYETYWRSRAEKAEKELGMATERYNAQIFDANRRAIALSPGVDKDRVADSTRAFDAEIDSASTAKKTENRATDIADGKFCTSCGAPYDSAETSVPKAKEVKRFRPSWIFGLKQSSFLLAFSIVSLMLEVFGNVVVLVPWFFSSAMFSWTLAVFFAVIFCDGKWTLSNHVPLSEKRRCTLAGHLKEARAALKEARAALKAEIECGNANVDHFEVELAKKDDVIDSVKSACQAELDRLLAEINNKILRLSKETVPLSRAITSLQPARVAIGNDCTEFLSTPHVKNEPVFANGKPASKVVATFSWIDDHEVKIDELALFKKADVPKKM